MSKFYAVKEGYVTGVFDSWPKAAKQVQGYKGAVFKSFPTKQLAQQWLNGEKRRVVQNNINKQETDQPDIVRPSSTSPPKCLFDETEDKSNEPLTTSRMPLDKRITVWTDGACQNHPILGAAQKVAGVGVWWGHDDPKNVSQVFEIPPITNQRAELAAILVAIKMFLKDHAKDDKYLLVETDSMYSIKCLTIYRHGWSKKGWRKADGTEVLNLDLIKELDRLLNANGGRIYFHHVMGHTGIEGNEAADQLATGCLSKYRETN